MVAFRTSAWTSANLKFADRPDEDPNRSELLLLHVAAEARYEVWQAPITRSSAGLPSVGLWELYATEEDDLDGNLPYHIRAALESRGASRGPTIPAANMVLAPWDVPSDVFPLIRDCGPLDFARERTSSTYVAIYRPELPGPVIASQALVYKRVDEPPGHIKGAMETLLKAENTEFVGPPLGAECHYFEGQLRNIYRYTALWRYPGVVCEVTLGAPRGQYSREDVYRYAAIQDKRAIAELSSGRLASSW